MLAALKFVQGSISRTDLVPALSHFSIKEGKVRGYNGALALCTPIPFDIACNPKAEPLIKAISNCDDTVALSLTPAGRLSVKSGAFKALIDCVDGETPHVVPEGNTIELDGVALLKSLKVLEKFIGNDASRPWSNGVLLKGQSAFATNNVTLVEYWTGSTFTNTLCIPRAAIKEILRIGEPPTAAQCTDSNITFHFEGKRWLRTQILSTGWPDLHKVLDKPSLQEPIDASIFQALVKLKPFCDKFGRIYISKAGISTHEDWTEGAAFEIAGIPDGVYNVEMLANLEGTAVSIDWSAYPAPCIFQGDRLRGAIVGMRKA